MRRDIGLVGLCVPLVQECATQLLLSSLFGARGARAAERWSKVGGNRSEPRSFSKLTCIYFLLLFCWNWKRRQGPNMPRMSEIWAVHLGKAHTSALKASLWAGSSLPIWFRGHWEMWWACSNTCADLHTGSGGSTKSWSWIISSVIQKL